MRSSTPSGAPEPPPAAYYYTPSYKGLPRVVLLVGTAWKLHMRAHYGLDGKPLFSRPAYPGEPCHFEGSRHPFGWVFPPEGAIRYEAASGMPPPLLDRLAELLQEQLAATPFETAEQQQAFQRRLAAALGEARIHAAQRAARMQAPPQDDAAGADSAAGQGHLIPNQHPEVQGA